MQRSDSSFLEIAEITLHSVDINSFKGFSLTALAMYILTYPWQDIFLLFIIYKFITNFIR
jgi:hypothetical protein